MAQLSRAWYGIEISIWNMEDARMECNGRFQEWNGTHCSVLPYQISHMASAQKYIQIVITKNMWKRLAANHLRQINRVMRS